ncbi:MAG: hypothetical protein KJ042_15180 [Deltaproteobacteria bacterium]|nr:hypothetical protein [Deltaproteobacteria bacterium]
MQPFEPLTHDELSPRLQQILPQDAPTAVKMAAANGFVPLGTQDLITCFYHLANDEDANIKRTARNSLRDLPPDIIRTALQSGIHEKILHWFAHRRFEDPTFHDLILLNRNSADETFAYLAGQATSERTITLIAQNEDRFVRMPEILEALELNAHTPISVLNRARDFFLLQIGLPYTEVLAQKRRAQMEQETDEEAGAAGVIDDVTPRDEVASGDEHLAEGFDSPIPADWRDELPPDFSLAQLQMEVFSRDDDFAAELLVDPEDDIAPQVRESLQMKVNRLPVLDKLRLAMKGNIEARNILIKSPIRLVQECVLRNPKITVEEIVKLAKDKTQSEDIIRVIAANRDWTRNYAVVHALCWNPKTPINMSGKMLGKLTVKDLGQIGKSKQVPGILTVQARKLATEKQRFQ